MLCTTRANCAAAQPPTPAAQAAVQSSGPAPVPNASSAAATAPQPRTQPANFLAWEAEAKTYEAKPGELTAHFTFYVTNVSAEVVVITSLQRSCGCTEASMPAQPWNLAAGTNGPIQFYITVDGQKQKVFEANEKPVITTKVGAVEDWTIENRALETHAFHIHQIHFLVLAVDGKPVANNLFGVA
jgi:FtsP/CotA-like multicopper oxidase with cupredoxin domain